ncbi:MAG: VanZ family protein [Verrucomicrobia subdivision 3 bacterium]|nr:VanZ family protein [Limisphaerales bacterium]
MALIFGASSDTKSSRHSSRIIEPIVRWLVPDISAQGVARIVFLVRKAAHVTEYAILAALVGQALVRPGFALSPNPAPPVIFGKLFAAWLIASLYSSTDELHQALVPNREGRWSDVGIDSMGAAFGVLLLYAVWRWRLMRIARRSARTISVNEKG